MDFAAVDRFTIDRRSSTRTCPDCAIPLQTLRVDTGAGIFSVERCERCFGLFFPVGAVQGFLDASVSPAFTINLHEIMNINEDRSTFSRPVRYIKCPDCSVMMNRVNYAAMSGVVVDQCKDHGVWLDNGELVHLMEWKKAGGALLAEKEKLAQQGLQRQESRLRFTVPDEAAPESNASGDLLAEACSALLRILFR